MIQYDCQHYHYHRMLVLTYCTFCYKSVNSLNTLLSSNECPEVKECGSLIFVYLLCSPRDEFHERRGGNSRATYVKLLALLDLVL